MTSPLFLTTLTAAIVLVIRKLWTNYVFNKEYKLPPRVEGGLPFFGNTFQMPAYHQGPWAKDMAKKYGEMFTCQVGSNTWVFLNSSRVVNDLLEKRSAIYSSRPPFPMASTIMSDNCRIVIQPYGEKWRSIRKIMHSILNKQNAPTFAPFQDLESKHLLHDYLHNPDQWFVANQRFANSVIMSVVFGKRLGLGDPSTTELFETSGEFISALQPGANLVDAFYFLDRIPKPLQWWRRRGQRIFAKTVNVYQREVNDVVRRMKEGVARNCFATSFLRNPETENISENQKLFALGSLMEAGSDTSRMTISQIIAAAATDPRWVTKARDELDSVCGHNAERLPSFDDRERLPYTSAVTKEGFRWRPFAEIGMPHLLIKDDEYEGYKFPAGTLFTWNSWNISLSPEEYDDPERFWPERFLKNMKDLSDPLKGHWSFGPGRRVCAGYNVGDANVWIAVSRLIFCFNFEQIPGQNINTFNSNWSEYRTAPFPVKITVRSPAHAALIEREGKKAIHVRY
ncbi:cytochrome P450 [Glonium stellatum]|uniref:Cytochrome P450 n=1 Tax=Glonium stellatum TaxID=574774 RepID=A0A8E2EY01_9PEZI|nr:cytochrome P450 [Glonium stellatum]